MDALDKQCGTIMNVRHERVYEFLPVLAINVKKVGDFTPI
jgi:hypothetical protein